MTHECIISPDGTEPICSHALTPAMLTGMGFPVKHTSTIAGVKIVDVEGAKFERARHDAWVAGKTRLCSRA